MENDKKNRGVNNGPHTNHDGCCDGHEKNHDSNGGSRSSHNGNGSAERKNGEKNNHGGSNTNQNGNGSHGYDASKNKSKNINPGGSSCTESDEELAHKGAKMCHKCGCTVDAPGEKCCCSGKAMGLGKQKLKTTTNVAGFNEEKVH